MTLLKHALSSVSTSGGMIGIETGGLLSFSVLTIPATSCCGLLCGMDHRPYIYVYIWKYFSIRALLYWHLIKFILVLTFISTHHVD